MKQRELVGFKSIGINLFNIFGHEKKYRLPI